MSQSRFSIVLVGVSALLRRPFVSRLRPAVFSARGSGGFRRSVSPSVSALAAGRVGLRAHDFRFSARTASGLPLGGLALPPSASEIAARWVGSSAFRFGDCRSVGWPSGSRLPLFGTHRFGIALGELAFGLTASAFRHAPLRGCRSAGWFFCLPLRGCPRRVGLRTHRFRFSARTASELPSASWFFFLPLLRWPLGGLAFGFTTSAFRHAPLRGCRSASWFFRLPLRRLPLGGLGFGLTASAFRHAPLRSCRSASWFCRLPFRGCPRRVGSSAFRFGDCRSAGWPSGSRLPLFGTHRFGVAARRVGLRAHRFRFSARTDPHRLTAEARADGAHRHDTCFTSKHLSQHVNLPHRSPQALQNRQTPLLSPTRHPRG